MRETLRPPGGDDLPVAPRLEEVLLAENCRLHVLALYPSTSRRRHLAPAALICRSGNCRANRAAAARFAARSRRRCARRDGGRIDVTRIAGARSPARRLCAREIRRTNRLEITDLWPDASCERSDFLIALCTLPDRRQPWRRLNFNDTTHIRRRGRALNRKAGLAPAVSGSANSFAVSRCENLRRPRCKRE
jgi:hypothetical protein